MIIRGGRKELERRAADLLADALANVLARRPVAGFGVVGGRSVGNVLQLLGRAQVDWGRVHFFMLDERLVPPDHPDANYRLVASFVSSFLPPANLHPFLHEPGDKQAALLRYRRELENSAGRLEVLLLSSGEDGHIASLFPEHETIDSQDDYFLVTASAPKPPPQRMSASPKLIARASSAVLLFFGSAKQQAFRECLDDTVSVRRCPAGLVRTIDNHYILTDSDGGAGES
jgi:6-phosphogluconolactonase